MSLRIFSRPYAARVTALRSPRGRVSRDRHRVALTPRLVITLGMALVTPATPAHAQGGATITGIVRDAGTRAPIPDAVVLVRMTVRAATNGSGTRIAVGTGAPRGAQTDEAGRYTLAALPSGEAMLTVQRLGYAPAVDSISLADGRTATLDVALSPAAQVIAPMVVSATREAQTRTENSATIDAIDGTAIREARAAHPAAIAQRIPGVHISQLSGEGHSTAIRQPISTKPLYLYLEDGVPTRSTGFFNHNALYEVNLPQAGGMEVLKGPGTALYGSDAIGGVVNVLTRPAPATPSIDVSVEGGSYGYHRALLTGGLTHGAHGLRVDVNRTTADGFKDDAPYKRLSATVRHDLSTSSGWSFRTVVTGTSVEQRDVFALDATQFDRRPALNRSPIAYRDVSALRWHTAAEFERGTTLVSVTPFARRNVLDLLPNWQLGYNPETWDTRNSSWGALVKLRRDFAPWRTRVIAGADLEVSPGSARNTGIVTGRTGPDSAWTSYTLGAVHYDYDVTFRQASPYLHTEFSPLPRTRFDVGLRYDHSGYRYASHLAAVQTGRFRVPADTSPTYARWSPKAGVTVDLRRDLNLYASYREGFRAPAQSQLFQQGANLNTVGLEPVTASSKEVGARGNLTARATWQVAAYEMRVRNDILSVLDAQGIQTTSNAGATRHRGLEVSLSAALLADLRLDVAHSRASHQYERWVIPVGGQNRDYAGKTMEQAPDALTNVLLSWSPGALHGGRLAAEWSGTGRYYMDPENSHSYAGFALWTLHANYMLRGVGELFARVTNLANRRYAELVSYNAFSREQFTPGNPRMVFAGVRFTWER